MEPRPSTIFFPLRTSVELFKDPRSAAAVTRAKQAAILYERLIFEVGLLDVTIGTTGATTWWTPPSQITPEHLKLTREPIPTGTRFSLSMGAEDAPGTPAKEMRTFISDSVSVAFAAEWHSDVLDGLAEFRPEWVESLAVGGELPSSHPVGKEIADQNFRDWTDRTLLPDTQHFEREFIYKSFNRDSAIAAHLGAAFSLTPLFAAMIERRAVSRVRGGDDALSLLIPNVGALPWEAVLEFREHPGSREARSMLAEFEIRAAESEPESAIEYLQSVSRQLVSTYAQALADQRPRLGEELAKEALKTGVSFFPAVGPIVEKTATAAQMVSQERAWRRSWTAAVMKLQRASDEVAGSND